MDDARDRYAGTCTGEAPEKKALPAPEKPAIKKVTPAHACRHVINCAVLAMCGATA